VPGDPLQLEYAPPPGNGRRLVRKWLTAVAILMGLWWLVEWGPASVRHMRLLYVQQRCASFDFPADTVIYDSDPATGQKLLADAENYIAIDDPQVWPTRAVIRREPDCWESLKSNLFGGRNFWPPGPAAPKALIHRLRNDQGDERLVAIIIAPSVPGRFNTTTRELGVVAAVVRPGEFNVPPRWDGNSDFLRAGFEKATRLRFYAAHLDPHDPAKFTIRYEMDGQPGTIDGRLAGNADVTLTIRDGPAKAVDPSL
jgi:hypothetical protein